MAKAKCDECSREFDLFDEEEAEEFYYGHDCEPEESQLVRRQTRFKAALGVQVLYYFDTLIKAVGGVRNGNRNN